MVGGQPLQGLSALPGALVPAWPRMRHQTVSTAGPPPGWQRPPRHCRPLFQKAQQQPPMASPAKHRVWSARTYGHISYSGTGCLPAVQTRTAKPLRSARARCSATQPPAVMMPGPSKSMLPREHSARSWPVIPDAQAFLYASLPRGRQHGPPAGACRLTRGLRLPAGQLFKHSTARLLSCADARHFSCPATRLPGASRRFRPGNSAVQHRPALQAGMLNGKKPFSGLPSRYRPDRHESPSPRRQSSCRGHPWLCW